MKKKEDEHLHGAGQIGMIALTGLEAVSNGIQLLY